MHNLKRPPVSTQREPLTFYYYKRQNWVVRNSIKQSDTIHWLCGNYRGTKKINTMKNLRQ